MPLCPDEIRSIREEIGWSAREMARFFRVTHATIYNWESGESSPSACVQGLLLALRKRLRTHRQHVPKAITERWLGSLADEGVYAFVTELQEDANGFSRPTTYEALAEQVCEHGPTLLEIGREPVAYVVPLGGPGQERFTEMLASGELESRTRSPRNPPLR